MVNGVLGVIIGARGTHLSVGVEGRKRIGFYYPTWEIQYLTAWTNMQGSGFVRVLLLSLINILNQT